MSQLRWTLVLLLTVLHTASALPAAGRAEEQERDSELDRLVNRIRSRVIDELGLSHTVVRNTTEDEMEEVMREYRRLVAEQSRPDADDEPAESVLELTSSDLERGWLVPGSSGGADSRSAQQVLRASFPLEDAHLSSDEHITSAELRVWVRAGRSGRRRRAARLAAYTVSGGRRKRLAVRPLPAAAGWVSLDVSDSVQQWPADSPLRVELRCRRCGRRMSDAAAPRLVLRRRTPRRVRRETADFLSQSEAMRSGSPVDCSNSHDQKCCRQKMEVNFKELGGFEQIIAPASFQAYHCRGGCPASYNVANDHALLQGWIHEKHKQGSKNMPHAHAPCCAPSKLSALPIAHYDAQGKVRITYWENVVVEECRCS